MQTPVLLQTLYRLALSGFEFEAKDIVIVSQLNAPVLFPFPF